MDTGEEFEKITTWKEGMDWEVAMEELRRRKEAVKVMGGKERIERHHRDGKYTIRERIDKLVDPGTFREAGSIMAGSQYDENGDIIGMTPAPFVCGTGEIDGRLVTVGGEDFTVHGGSPAGVPSKSHDFFMKPMAFQYGVPYVMLNDGVGHSAERDEQAGRLGRPSTGQIGRNWWPDVQLMHEVPVVSAILGSCAGIVAIRAMFAHFTIMTKGRGQIFPSGPPVVERAVHEVIDKESLGGWRMHVRKTGVVDNEAEDEEDCFRQIQQFLSYMPDNVHEVSARKDMGDDPNRREEELLGHVPIDRKKHYDPYKLIRLLVDKGEFFEMRKYYGRAVITAFARMDGYVVGILASNPLFNAGALDGRDAQKFERFIDLCNLFSIPLILIVDCPGYHIGSVAEQTGTVRYGATALMAAQEASVPKVHLAVRKAYGLAADTWQSAGSFGGKGFGLDLGWPSGEWGAIPIEGGVAAAYRRVIASAPDPEAKRKELEDRMVGMRSPFRNAEWGGIIEMIDPRDTRPIICHFVKHMQPYLKKLAALPTGLPKRSVRPG